MRWEPHPEDDAFVQVTYSIDPGEACVVTSRGETLRLPYCGTMRVAVLPNTPRGRAILARLVRLFEADFVFELVLREEAGAMKSSVQWRSLYHHFDIQSAIRKMREIYTRTEKDLANAELELARTSIPSRHTTCI